MRDSFKSRCTLSVNGQLFEYYSLRLAEKHGLQGVSFLPYSLRIMLENLLRNEDGDIIVASDIRAVVDWLEKRRSGKEVCFRPSRILMQDYTGIPALVDLAAMRDVVAGEGLDPLAINPVCPVDLVIDHSLVVDYAGEKSACEKNTRLEYDRNKERYAFLRWGQTAFKNFRVIPPSTGISHQINLEYLSSVASVVDNSFGTMTVFPDFVVGTDSHTSMINGLGVLGWGVGGIEAEAVMLGQPMSMLIPQVVGVRLVGKLREAVTATDLVLYIVRFLRDTGVVDKFVEFFGSALRYLSIPDRATISNMSPEFGATCGYFPIDIETIKYLKSTGRSQEQVTLIETYFKEQGLWYDSDCPEPLFTEIVEIDIGKIEKCLAGPSRPQDLVQLRDVSRSFFNAFKDKDNYSLLNGSTRSGGQLYNGDVVIAAITSCTNTSNPNLMIGAGLLAQKAVEKGLQTKPWVKTSFAPGSRVVAKYLLESGLQKSLNALGFHVVGFGCSTCVGNSGPISDAVISAIMDDNLIVSSVLSSNRNFEGRIHPLVKANYISSPALVVAYALLGSTIQDIVDAPIGIGKDGVPVFLKEIWPTEAEIKAIFTDFVKPSLFSGCYNDVFEGSKEWKEITTVESPTYPWDPVSSYIRRPPYVDVRQDSRKDIVGARALLVLGDFITTDQISPVGSILKDSPAGRYLIGKGINPNSFNSYGSRRGNHEVMMRGIFANTKASNQSFSNHEDMTTIKQLNEQALSVYDIAAKYAATNTPLIIIAGKEYGAGSSRDWAAKGPLLLGVKAILAESFERIHRSNLIGVGILPLQFMQGETQETLRLNGGEFFDVLGISTVMSPQMKATLVVRGGDKSAKKVEVICRLDTKNEIDCYQQGGNLKRLLNNIISSGSMQE